MFLFLVGKRGNIFCVNELFLKNNSGKFFCMCANRETVKETMFRSLGLGGEMQRSPTPILCVDAPPPGSFYRKLFRFLFYRLLFHCNKLARDAGGGIWGKGALTNNCSIEISWC